MDLLVSLVTLVQDAAKPQNLLGLNKAGAALGAGLCIVGGGLGIGRLASAALEGIARQPEAAESIGKNMVLAAALIEGVTLLAIITCILAIVL